jgi:protein-disulfide isomerase/uncharacterized membrane protein
MASKNRPQRTEATGAATSAGLSPGLYIAGLLLIIVSIAASFMLTLEHFGTSLPGCGPESDCARASRSFFGTIPGLGWPTAFLGLAYFLGVLVAWIRCRGGVPVGLRWLIRLGAVGSVVYMIAMLVGGYLCAYCVAVHLANFALLAVVEMSRKTDAGTRPALASVAVPFIVASLVLWPVKAQHEARAEQQQEQDLQETIDELTANSGNGVDASGESADGRDEVVSADPEPVESAQPFTGRFRRGPERAAIRLVAFTDFQCPDCKRIESRIWRIFNERDDMSVSVKHFPMSSTCNPRVRGANPHPNACWAARAAEAAGILGGNEAFWKMHDWLFEQGGVFRSKHDLAPIATEIGVDLDQLVATMQSAETERRIQKDIEEAYELGIYYTPMVFINGVEIKGYGVFANNAIERAIEALAATNPEPMTAAADRPKRAPQRYVDDWLEQRTVNVPSGPDDHWVGPEDAPVEIVVWGDYQETGTIEVDSYIREALGDDPEGRYCFRQFPVHTACNPDAWKDLHDQACRAAQAAVAAGRLGGDDAFWTMHEWLMSRKALFTDGELRDIAVRTGLDPDALLDKMYSPEVASQIVTEAALMKRLIGRKLQVPAVYVNGKRVPRPRREGAPIMKLVVERALQDARGE